MQAVELLHLVHNAGFDGVFIDLEHSALSLESANRICVQAMPLQLSPFVRVPFQCGRGFVQRVLDGGAQGVIFPHVDTVGTPNACFITLPIHPIPLDKEH